MIARLFSRIYFSILFFIFFTISGISQSQTQHLDKSLLWKIEGNGLKVPSYLFGTMHILCSDDASLSDSLIMAINTVDEIYFEIDMTDMMGMMSAMKYMKMNDNKTLADVLSPTDYGKVKKYFEEHPSQLPFNMLEHFKPMLISSLVDEAGLPCGTTDGMEMEIMHTAKKINKKINGLETASFQASLFDSIPYSEQAMELVQSIDSIEQNKLQMDTLNEAYKSQDLKRIEELTLKGDPGTSKYLDLLLFDRNKKWVNELQNLLPQKSILIAVGAGHLPGAKGLIKLLREKGFILTPIFSPKKISGPIALK